MNGGNKRLGLLSRSFLKSTVAILLLLFLVLQPTSASTQNESDSLTRIYSDLLTSLTSIESLTSSLQQEQKSLSSGLAISLGTVAQLSTKIESLEGRLQTQDEALLSLNLQLEELQPLPGQLETLQSDYQSNHSELVKLSKDLEDSLRATQRQLALYKKLSVIGWVAGGVIVVTGVSLWAAYNAGVLSLPH